MQVSSSLLHALEPAKAALNKQLGLIGSVKQVQLLSALAKQPLVCVMTMTDHPAPKKCLCDSRSIMLLQWVQPHIAA